MLLVPAAAYCNGDSVPQPDCPGADAWNAAHVDQMPEAAEKRDSVRTLTDPGLREQLKARFEADQDLRNEYLHSPHDQSIVRRVEILGAENLTWLKQLVNGSGLPTAHQVGERGLEWVWVLAQHADRDPEFQAKLLPMFVERYEAGELPAEYVAKLTDRVLLAKGKSQRFGTQFNWLAGRFKLPGHVERDRMDAYRKEIGLMPLEDYACMMSAKMTKRKSLK